MVAASATSAAARSREMQLISRPAAGMGRSGVRATRPGGGGSSPDMAQAGEFQAHLAPHGHETPGTVQGPLKCRRCLFRVAAAHADPLPGRAVNGEYAHEIVHILRLVFSVSAFIKKIKDGFGNYLHSRTKLRNFTH